MYELHGGATYTPPPQSVSVGFVGTASLTRITTFVVTGPSHTTTILTGDGAADVLAAISVWDGQATAAGGQMGALGWPGHVWALTLAIGATTARVLYVVGQYQTNVGMPPAYSWLGPSEIEEACTGSVDAIHRDEEVTADETPDRNPLDFTDYSRLGAWVGDEDTTFTLTGGGETVTGSFPYSGDLDFGNTDFRVSLALSASSFVSDGVTVAGILGLEVLGGPVSLAGLDLYKPGTAGTDPAGDGWCRTGGTANCARLVASGGDILLTSDGTYTTGQGWTGIVSALTTVNFKELPTDWYAPNATVTGPVIEWTWNGSAWVSSKKEWAGSYTANQQYSSWLWAYERQAFDALDGCSVIATDAWRAAQGEDVGGSNPATNDAQAGVLCHPISDATRTGSVAPWWGPMLTLAHAASVELNDPADATGRPSLWTALTGASVDAGDNDAWAVTAGAVGPRVTRELATRYWLRLNNLEGYAGDPELPRNFDWSIILRPNQHTLEALGDDVAWDTSVPYEDEWHWGQFCYLRLGLTAPKAGDVTLRVDYSTVSVDDPCYSSVEYRADEFTYSRTRHVATYTVTVAVGANDLYIDLACLNEEFIPTGSVRMMHVDELTFTLPDSEEVSDPENWALTGLALTLAPTDSYAIWRFKREWMWASHKSFGFGALVDGLPALQLRGNYGYDHTRNEDGLVYIQYAQHDPDSAATSDPSSSKPLARLYAELNWQRGWTTTWSDPEASSYNEDADGNRLKGTFDWWELKPCEAGGESPLEGCVMVGQFDIVQGIEQDVWYLPGPPRGAFQGLLKTPDETDRVRNGTDVVAVYEAGVLVGRYDTDAQGNWTSGYLTELGGPYIANGHAGTIVNREFTWLEVLQQRNLVDPFITTGAIGDVWRVAEYGGVVYADRAGADYTFEDAAQPFGTTDGYSRPSCAIMPDGSVIVAATRGGTMERARTRDHGETWEVC